jgi:hypothetical protein
MKIFLDDQWELPGRNPGEGWVCVRTAKECVDLLQQNQGRVTHLSLDSDLGFEYPDVRDYGDFIIGEGPDVTMWLAMNTARFVDFWPTEFITIHSRNSQGRAKMESDIRRYCPRDIYAPSLI